jgi:hypothetical protein
MGSEGTNNYGNNTISTGLSSQNRSRQCGRGEWADSSNAPELNFWGVQFKQDIRYPDWGYALFSLVPPDNYHESTFIRAQPLLSKYFPMYN